MSSLTEWRSHFLPVAEICRRLEGLGEMTVVSSGATAGPTRLFKVRGFLGEIGFISPVSEHRCGSCNRLRLTAQGRLRPCQLAEDEVDIKEAMRSNCSDQDLASLFREAIQRKAQQFGFFLANQNHPSRSMAVIGG